MKTKVIVITGAAGGIGQESCRKFVAAGYKVVALDRDIAGLKPIIEEFPNQMTAKSVDLLAEKKVEDTVAEILREEGSIDILFNIAGGSGRRFGDGPIDQCTEEGFDQTIALNVKTQFFINKYVVRVMLQQKVGCIINVTSVLGMVGGGEHFSTHAYAASKAAIIGMTKAMAIHYAKDNIRVNAIAPGLIETPMSTRAQSDEAILDYMDFMQPIYQTKHQLGQPKSVVKAAEFLASDEADFITGIVLPVDGGWTAR